MHDLAQNAPQYLEIASLVIAAASVVANLTKTDSDNKWIARISKIINLFALNFRVK